MPVSYYRGCWRSVRNLPQASDLYTNSYRARGYQGSVFTTWRSCSISEPHWIDSIRRATLAAKTLGYRRPTSRPQVYSTLPCESPQVWHDHFLVVFSKPVMDKYCSIFDHNISESVVSMGYSLRPYVEQGSVSFLGLLESISFCHYKLDWTHIIRYVL